MKDKSKEFILWFQDVVIEDDDEDDFYTTDQYFDRIKWERNLNDMSNDELVKLSKICLPPIVDLKDRKMSDEMRKDLNL